MWSPEVCSVNARAASLRRRSSAACGGRAGISAIAARADQVLAARLLERPANLEVILGLEELHQRPLQLPVAQMLGDVDRLLGERVEARVVHAGRDVERAGDEILHLVGAVMVALEEQRQVDHRVERAAGVAGDEVGDQELLLAGGAARPWRIPGRISRNRRWPASSSAPARSDRCARAPPSSGRRRDARPARACTRDCLRARSMRMPEATKTFFTPGVSRASFISSTSGPWSVPSSLQTVGWTQLSRRQRASTSGRRAAHLVHVGRRAADVADDALELGIGGHLADFAEHRLRAAALDDAAFVGRDRAERAAAEAAAHDLHRVFHHFIGRDLAGRRSSGCGLRVNGRP